MAITFVMLFVRLTFLHIFEQREAPTPFGQATRERETEIGSLFSVKCAGIKMVI